MKSFSLFFVLSGMLFLSACIKDKTKDPLADGGYPANIAPIMVGKCATAGCHNTQSKSGAGGLDFSTWEKAMEGGNGGASIIPYYHKQSTVFLFTNTYDDLGAKVIPTMPYNGTPLNRTEVVTLRDWIDAGAPDKNGFVKFSDNAQRKKIYITNQGCDLVAVVDEETKLIMRYIPVGISNGSEAPHAVRIAADGSFWCVSFIAGTVLQKFSATDDKLLGSVDIGPGSWNTFAISHDGTKAYCLDWSSAGKLTIVDLVSYQVIGGTNGLYYPHGSALSTDEKYLYATSNTGNFIYKIDVSDPANPDAVQIAVDNSQAPITTSSLDIHEIVFSPDRSKYFLTCQKSNEVRVMNAANDSLLAVLPVGVYPQEMSTSATMPYLFVTCMEDDQTFPGNRGSVYVIDYNALTVKSPAINTGWQPHGIAVDDAKNVVYVVNRNATTGGPAPHHTTDCAGRDGYLTLIDLNTLQLVPGFKTELSVDPYSAAVR